VMFKATALEMRRSGEEMNRWMAAGRLKANIAQRFPLGQAAEAHRLQETANVGGKVVLTCD